MIDVIKVYGVSYQYIENHNDCEILREIAKRTYKNCRAIVSDDDYSDYDADKTYFYSNKSHHLGYLETVIYETVTILKRNITYKPQLKQLNDIEAFMRNGSCLHQSKLVRDVVNDIIYKWEEDGMLPKDEIEYLETIEDNPKLHMEFIIKECKWIINVLCKIIKDNELKRELYR